MSEPKLLSGLKLIDLKIFQDNRGFFVERYQEARFKEYGLPQKFIQDNHSRSKPGVIRGFHFQSSPSQGKLVGVVRGKIWDVVVDIRSKSPTLGQWQAFELSDEDGKLLWIPEGFAHGFCVLGNEPADVTYKVDAPHSPQTEGGFAYNDPTLAVTWPLKNPIVSAKDEKLPSFQEYLQKPVF